MLHFSTSVALMPDTVGLTRGCMPYQDPVYSQPKRLPGTHFHNVACGLLRKRIPPRQRCTVILPVFFSSSPSSHLFSSDLTFPSLFILALSLCALFDLFPSQPLNYVIFCNSTSVIPGFQEHTSPCCGCP